MITFTPLEGVGAALGFLLLVLLHAWVIDKRKGELRDCTEEIEFLKNQAAGLTRVVEILSMDKSKDNSELYELIGLLVRQSQGGVRINTTGDATIGGDVLGRDGITR